MEQRQSLFKSESCVITMKSFDFQCLKWEFYQLLYIKVSIKKIVKLMNSCAKSWFIVLFEPLYIAFP